MSSQEVQKAIDEGGLEMICPELEPGSIKVFDGRIGHQGMANPVGGNSRKATYAVHHAHWYKER